MDTLVLAAAMLLGVGCYFIGLAMGHEAEIERCRAERLARGDK